MGERYDEETDIQADDWIGSSTEYYPYIEVCLSGERNLLYPMIDFPGVLHWMPVAPQSL
ncbi:hypothetical protein BDN71DRAFT_1456053 [Pleurotus eryngii]|uniref:Uncharacterized protein n=1 Tax=Pleurotus eryngii TaxID=5323 RepID=A0A9P5ZL13_PLEER|nr:hypothetical protein BDN71DRAFT_1456053 [Pleurotus eryngii]